MPRVVMTSLIWPPECPVCQKTFSTEFDLQQHIFEIHERPGDYKCNECGEAFSYVSRLERHYLVHTRNEQNKCDQCSASYKKLTDLKNHQARHSIQREVTNTLYRIQQKIKMFEGTEDDGEPVQANSEKKSVREKNEPGWVAECGQLLNELIRNVDSKPFCVPIDVNECPDYLEKVSTPMDLSTIKERLLSGEYNNPNDLNKDLKLIFYNSKLYNTDKRRAICGMTLRLQSLADEKIKRILHNYKLQTEKLFYRCPECEETFKWKGSLARHRNLVHTVGQGAQFVDGRLDQKEKQMKSGPDEERAGEGKAFKQNGGQVGGIRTVDKIKVENNWTAGESYRTVGDHAGYRYPAAGDHEELDIRKKNDERGQSPAVKNEEESRTTAGGLKLKVVYDVEYRQSD